MNGLSEDQKGIVNGIVGYLKNDKGLETTVPKVQKFLTRVTSQAKKENMATVTTAVPLSDAEKKSLAKILTGILGHEIDITSDVKPDVIGGMRIQVADWVVDTTVSSQLSAMAGLLVG